MSESAVSDKPLLFYGLARNRRSPKRPSEPRFSGVHPEEVAVGMLGQVPLAGDLVPVCYSYRLIVRTLGYPWLAFGLSFNLCTAAR